MNNLKIDQIIDANMTVTDHLLRAAIHSVVVDAVYESVKQEREACAQVCEDFDFMKSNWIAAKIRARGEP